MTQQPHPAIRVAARGDSFRRAGHVFGAEPQTIALAALSPDAHAAIVDDPSLVVVETVAHLDTDKAQALPYHDAPHVKAAAAHTEWPAPVDHAARAQTLDQREAALQAQALASQQDHERLAQGEADLAQHEAALQTQTLALQQDQERLAQREAELDQREARLASERAAFDAEAAKHGEAAKPVPKLAARK
jgi:hypothetical protein